MAQSNVLVRLSLKDADAVQRGLVALGADGEKALKRIEAAGRAPSAGPKALGAASDELKGKFSQLSGNAGVVGSALETLGPRGLLAAAGIGALVAALGFATAKAREAIEHFSALQDSAQRVGLSVEGFQSLTVAFGAIGVDADGAEKAFTRLNDAIGKVKQDGAEAPTEVKQAFDALGITMADVQKHGDDLDWMIAAMAEGFRGLTSTAEQTTVAKALFGKEGAKLIPLLELGAAGLRREQQAAKDLGAVLGEDLVEHLDTLGDRLDALDKVLDVQSARSFGAFGEGLVEVKQFTADLWTGINDLLDLLKADLGDDIFKQLLKQNLTILGPLSEAWKMFRDIYNWASRDQHGASGEWVPGGGGATGDWAPPATAKADALAQGSGHGGWPATAEQQTQARAQLDKAAAQLDKELAAVARWKEAWLQADGDVAEALAVRYQQQLQHAEIKDATRLTEAKELIQATFLSSSKRLSATKIRRSTRPPGNCRNSSPRSTRTSPPSTSRRCATPASMPTQRARN
jgi:hypothetical protein